MKFLDKRRYTQSELSGELKLSVPTVKEHLDALEKAGLVKKLEEGYKWKYYALTEKSKCLLDPERKKVWILLTSLLISLTAGILTFFSGIMFIGAKAGIASEKALSSQALESAPSAAPVVAAAPANVNILLVGSLVLFILAIVFFVLFIYYFRKSRIMRKK